MSAVYPVLCLGLALLTAATATASDYESRTLMATGAWSVEVVHDTSSGELFCSGTTTNRGGQQLGLTAFDDGYLGIFVFDGKWKLAERDISFLMDVDHSRWEMTGAGGDQTIHVGLNGNEGAGKFMEQLAGGSAVTILNADERRLATFSLRGSHRAILALLDCWKRIGAATPFQRASDPF